jgi:NAD(P)-dependent dehydrogenase (short-subunit alcohol dehydrogenase family)
VISPGAVNTPRLLGLAGPDDAKQKELLAALAAEIRLGHVGDPDDVASAALFLASEDARFIAGSEIVVDGGTAQV